MTEGRVGLLAKPQKTRIIIELNRAQINDVLRQESGVGAAFLAIPHLQNSHAWITRLLERNDPKRLSDSLLTGLLVLASLPSDRSWVKVTDFARDCGLNSSTTHRYLATLHAVGIIEQDPQSRQYRLVDVPTSSC
jgi:hypothetical protein